MTAEEIQREIERHEWEAVRLKAALHDEEEAVALLRAMHQAALAKEERDGGRGPRG